MDGASMFLIFFVKMNADCFSFASSLRGALATKQSDNENAPVTVTGTVSGEAG